MYIKKYDAFTDYTSLNWEDKLTQFNSLFIRENKCELLIAEGDEQFEINFPNNIITPGSKIFFNKACSFPSLLLGRIQKEHPEIKLKRVVKKEEADFIVYDAPVKIIERQFLTTCELEFEQVEELFKRGRITNDTIKELTRLHGMCPGVKFAFNISDWDVVDHQQYIEEEMGMPLMRAINPAHPQAILQCLEDAPKAILTRDLVKYIYSFIPQVGEEEVITLLNYMRHGDDATRNMTINALQYMNLSGVLYPVMKWFNRNMKEYELGNTTAWKYLYFILDAQPNDLCSYQANRRAFLFVDRVLNNSLNTTTLDDYKQEILENVQERLRRENADLMADLERLNCDFEIIEKECDEDRETGTSDTEMEGSGSLRDNRSRDRGRQNSDSTNDSPKNSRKES